MSSEPAATRLTSRQLYRIVAPRRKRLGWVLAFTVVWVSFGLCCLMYFAGEESDAWLLPPVVVGLLMVPAATVFLPAALGAVLLWEDRRAGRLESLLLTGADGLAVLRAYHRRAFVTAVLLLVLFAPTWAILGRAPAPLLFVESVFECQLENPNILAAPRFASGLLADLATAWLAATLGLSLLAWLRSRAWAIVLASLGTLGFGALGWLGGTWLTELLDAWNLKWYEHAFLFGRPVEPVYSTLLWYFSITFSAAAFLLSELVIRRAARRLDRLVTD